MKRRDFLRIAATSGGMLLCGGVRLAQAQQAYNGPFWLLVEARGGWDPTSFCDPKGSGLGENGDINKTESSRYPQLNSGEGADFGSLATNIASLLTRESVRESFARGRPSSKSLNPNEDRSAAIDWRTYQWR